MTLAAFFIILISVFLHAGWNFISKRSKPSGAFYLLSSLTASLMWLPFILWGGVDLTVLPVKFWVLLIFSGVFEVMYLVGLAYAYRKTDISLAYPLARALPVLMVAVVTIICGFGTRPGVPALIGMAIVSVGCFLMPLENFREIRMSHYFNKAILFILLAAVGTTGYTVLDSESIAIMRNTAAGSRMMQSMVFLGMMEALIVVGMACFVMIQPLERQEFKRLFLKSFYPVLTGVFSSSAYMLILIAMGLVSNVSYLQAFRQMSLPVGVLAGVLLLKEKHGLPKIVGVGMVLAGLVMVSLG